MVAIPFELYSHERRQLLSIIENLKCGLDLANTE
jgi:hypothetical protein